MRSYGSVAASFWTGETGRQIVSDGSDCIALAVYLMTCPHSNMLGLYYLPIQYVAHDLQMPKERVKAGLAKVCERGFATYDEGLQWVFVHNMAAQQVGTNLSHKDNRVKSVQNAYYALPKNPFNTEFYDKYKDDFHLEKPNPLATPCRPLLKQEQEQEQEQEQDNTYGPSADESDEASKAEPAGEPAKPANNTPKPASKMDYPEEFERLWASYPKRDGANPKRKAYMACRARVTSGWGWQLLVDAANQYRQHCDARGKTGTPYVQQAATFYGPDEHFANDWTPEPPPGKPDDTGQAAIEDAKRRRQERRAREAEKNMERGHA